MKSIAFNFTQYSSPERIISTSLESLHPSFLQLLCEDTISIEHLWADLPVYSALAYGAEPGLYCILRYNQVTKERTIYIGATKNLLQRYRIHLYLIMKARLGIEYKLIQHVHRVLAQKDWTFSFHLLAIIPPQIAF